MIKVSKAYFDFLQVLSNVILLDGNKLIQAREWNEKVNLKNKNK